MFVWNHLELAEMVKLICHERATTIGEIRCAQHEIEPWVFVSKTLQHSNAPSQCNEILEKSEALPSKMF